MADDTVCTGKRSGQPKPEPRISRECGYLCRDKGRFFGFKTNYRDCQCMEEATSVDDCKIYKEDMHLFEYKGKLSCFYFDEFIEMQKSLRSFKPIKTGEMKVTAVKRPIRPQLSTPKYSTLLPW